LKIMFDVLVQLFHFPSRCQRRKPSPNQPRALTALDFVAFIEKPSFSSLRPFRWAGALFHPIRPQTHR
jgi:hypothetical protein